MPICKQCSKQFHACSSCGLIYEWEYEYCCDICYEKSDDYAKVQNMKAAIDEVVSNISPELFDQLKEILYNDEVCEYFLNKFE